MDELYLIDYYNSGSGQISSEIERLPEDQADELGQKGHIRIRRIDGELIRDWADSVKRRMA